MDIETIIITPKDNIGKALSEAKAKSEFNNAPVLIKLENQEGESGKKDKAYLVSRDYFAEIIGRIYDVISDNSTTFARDDYDENDNPDFDRLKRIINDLYENSAGGKISIESIASNDTIHVDIEIFPAIDSKSSLSETIYLDETGQLDDLSLEDRIALDNGVYNFLQLQQATYEIERRPKAQAQLLEYERAKNGRSSLKRIEYIESNIKTNPTYKEMNFEKRNAGKYGDLLSRRINAKDRYLYGVLKDQHKIVVFSLRGHDIS